MRNIIILTILASIPFGFLGCADLPAKAPTTAKEQTGHSQPSVCIYTDKMEGRVVNGSPFKLRMDENGTLYSVTLYPIAHEDLRLLTAKSHEVWICLSIMEGSENKVSALQLAKTINEMLSSLASAKNAATTNVYIDVYLDEKK